MRAVIRQGLLGYTLSFRDDVPRPNFRADAACDRDRVLLRVLAGAINPVDYKLPRFLMNGPVVGFDVCGVVEGVGDRASSAWRVGDVVYGKAHAGSLAEHTTARADEVARAPPSSSSSWKPDELAALGVAYQSSLQCLQKAGILRAGGAATDGDGGGKAVLVLGASGGCGVAGLHLCRAAEHVTRIVAVCSAKNEAYVRDAGATEVVDYTQPSVLDAFFRDNAGRFDCVLDVATASGGGENYWQRSQGLLKKDTGTYTALNGPPTKWVRTLTGQEKKNQHLILCRSNTADLELLVTLLDKIQVRPLTTTNDFTEKGVQEAFQQLKSRRTKGKLTFNISEK